MDQLKTIPTQKPIKSETKSESFNRQKRNMFVIYGIGLIMLLIVLIYIKTYNTTHFNFLSKPCIFNIKGWTLTHVILYTFLGYFAPSLWYLLIIIGFLFEIVELLIDKLIMCLEYRMLDDPIANTVGLLFGIILYRIVPNKVDLYNNILTYFKHLKN
jgi:hypothetical protein